MNVINAKHSCTLNNIKSLSVILLTSLLFACQGETSAESVETIVEKSTGVTTIASDSAPVTKIVEEVKETVTETQAAVTPAPTPRPPADFSTLESSTYASVTEPFATSSGQDIEVVELFWFGCGHCFALEPHIKTWKKNKPANAKFKKVPAIFSQSWGFHAKAFYTFQALNLPEKVYDAFFTELHVSRKRINTLDQLTVFLAQFGKDKTVVENAFNSFAVDSQYRNALKITKQSGARGVPAMIVDGQYITNQTAAGGTKQMFDVVDKLVAKAAAEK